MPQPATAKGKGLSRKIGPLPLWAWASLALVTGYFLWKRLGSSATAGSQAQPPASTAGPDTGLPATTGTSGDTSGAGSAGVDPSQLLSALGAQQSDAFSQLAQALQAQEAQLQEQIAQQLAALGSSGGAPTVPPPDQPTVTPQPGGSNAPRITYSRVPASAPNFARAAQAQTAAFKAAGQTPAFGGVTNVRTTSTGTTITTYASGRVVEQAPGRTAYVAHA